MRRAGRVDGAGRLARRVFAASTLARRAPRHKRPRRPRPTRHDRARHWLTSSAFVLPRVHRIPVRSSSRSRARGVSRRLLDPVRARVTWTLEARPRTFSACSESTSLSSLTAHPARVSVPVAPALSNPRGAHPARVSSSSAPETLESVIMTDATSSATIPRSRYNEDGSAKDPIAFRDAIMADPEKRAAIEQDKELAAALLSDDTADSGRPPKPVRAGGARRAERQRQDELLRHPARAVSRRRGTPRFCTRTCSRWACSTAPRSACCRRCGFQDDIAQKQNEAAA